MQTSGFFVLSLWVLLFIAFPALSFPLIALDEQIRNAVSQKSPLRSRSDISVKNSDHQGPHLLDIALHKRAGRPIGNGITLHALRVATYIGARTVLENLYLKIFAEAANQPAGQMISYFEAEYGNVVVSFSSKEHFTWDLVKNFANMMLNRVHNGEQNFYIANIVVDLFGGMGQGSVRFLMGTPETRQDIANEPWAATLQQWLERHGL